MLIYTLTVGFLVRSTTNVGWFWVDLKSGVPLQISQVPPEVSIPQVENQWNTACTLKLVQQVQVWDPGVNG
jgi:hypothetical protein